MQTTEVARLYDRVAPQYSDVVASTQYRSPAWLEQKLAYTRSPGTILDLGCANGLLGILLRKRFPAATIDAVDISPNMVTLARDQNCYSSVRCHDLNQPMNWLRGSSYDLIVALGFTEFLSKPERFLAEAARILLHDGQVYLSFQEHWPHQPDAAPARSHSGEVCHRAFSMAQIAGMLERSGLHAKELLSTTGYISASGFACPYVFCVAQTAQ